MDLVIIEYKNFIKHILLGKNQWGLLIMGKDGRRGEREPKFLAVIIFSTSQWNDLGKSKKTVRGVSQKRFLSCQGSQ